MQINILATGTAPDYYTLSGETVTAHVAGVTDSYDLSTFPEGGLFTGVDPVNGVTPIRNIERINGVLKVTLCQQVGPGHWSESGWLDASQYHPDVINVKFDTTQPYSGRAYAVTRQGFTSPETV